MKLIFIHLLQTPIRKIYKLKNIIHDRWPRREMKRIFLNYVTMLKILTKNFKSNSLIKTQTHTRRLEKLGREGGLKIFSQMTWKNWSRNLMRGKNFQFNSRNDCNIWNNVSIHILNRHILIKDWIRNLIDTIRKKMFLLGSLTILS